MSFLLIMAAAFSVTAAPPPPSGDTGQAIVVEGTRDRRKPANDYLDKVIPPVFDAQLGRFEDRLCPSTIGLPANLKGEVMGRMRQVAAAAGVSMAGGNCTPNLVLIVVDDKKAVIEGMRREKQAYLYGIGRDRVKRLESSASPVAAWQITDVIGADGVPLRVDGDGFPRLFTTTSPSRLRTTTRGRLLGAVVIIETGGLLNVTTRQLADFTLVRALAPTQVKDKEAPSSSVMSLFNPGVRPEDAPQSLTWWDLAFIKALFDTRGDAVSWAQRTEIRDRMVKEMAKIRPEQR
jgi:hypothetical protein